MQKLQKTMVAKVISEIKFISRFNIFLETNLKYIHMYVQLA